MGNEAVDDNRTVRRKAKDSVFTVLFQDVNNVYELYKELHPEDVDVTVDDIHVETLETVLINDTSGIDTSDPAAYDKEIAAAGGVDLQLLGIGNNGHIGFNEPGTPFGSLTHIVELTESTREANKRFFASIDEVPTHAVTMGIKTVMQARSIILMAIGPAKAPIMKEMLQGPVTEKVPASVLQLHPDVTVYMDYEAAKLL